jgi:integrase
MLQAMTKLYWLTGARLGELTALTLNEIDRSGDVWRAHITRHKNSWRGQERTLLFGVESIALLTPWLRLHEPDSPIFSPRVVAPNSGRRGRRAPTKQYTKAALARAIRRACDRAFPHPELSKLRRKSLTASQKGELRDWRIAHRWTIGQIRHAAATRFREQHGIEVAQAILGHSKPDMTAHYSREAVARAIEAVRVAG